MRGYLNLGARYEVYGIRIAKEAVYYIIFEELHLLGALSELFEIIDDKVSPMWLTHHDPSDEVKILS